MFFSQFVSFEYLCYGSKAIIDISSAGTNFKRQNVTSEVDPRADKVNRSQESRDDENLTMFKGKSIGKYHGTHTANVWQLLRAVIMRIF